MVGNTMATLEASAGMVALTIERRSANFARIDGCEVASFIEFEVVSSERWRKIEAERGPDPDQPENAMGVEGGWWCAV